MSCTHLHPALILFYLLLLFTFNMPVYTPFILYLVYIYSLFSTSQSILQVNILNFEKKRTVNLS